VVVDRGVPYFCPDYRGRDRFDDVAVFLFVMLAVEIGVAWLGLSALGLIVVLTLVVYAVVLAPLAVPRRWLEAGGRGWLLPGVLLVGAVGVGLSPAVGLALGRVIDAVIFFAGLYAAFELADSDAWMREGPRLARRRAEVVSLTVIAVIVFALEGSVFHGPFDQTAVALVVALLILRLARSLGSPVQPAVVARGDAAGSVLKPLPRRDGAIL
jgi:hypothetical protein